MMPRAVSSLRRNQRGQALTEFTLVGIFVLLMLMAAVEMARTMWVYTTLANALKEGTRYAAMRGNYYYLTCANTPEATADPTVCQLNVKKVAQSISNAGPGLVPSAITNVQMTANGVTLSCPDQTLQSCLSASSPTAFDQANNMTLGSTFRITAQYQVSSVFAGLNSIFQVPTLPASAQEIVQF